MTTEETTKICPTDAELNEAMAQVCGWTYRTIRLPQSSKPMKDWKLKGVWYHPTIPHHYPIPDYCEDRNSLPEIWAAVTQADVWPLYIQALCHTHDYWPREIAAMITASPRKHVAAALKALGKWSSEWQEEEKVA